LLAASGRHGRGPIRLIGLAFLLLLLGFLLVFLSVLRVIDASFPMLLLADAASLTGLCLGIIGIAQERRSGP